MQEGEQVVGIAAGDVEAEVEVDRAMLVAEGSQATLELLVALGRLDELEFRGGGLQIGIQEDGVMPITRGVDADADGNGRSGRRVARGGTGATGPGIRRAGDRTFRWHGCGVDSAAGVLVRGRARSSTPAVLAGTRHGRSPQKGTR